MKKLLFFLSVSALSLAVLPTVQAQMFQNSNKDCQEIPISSSPSGMSVACKYYNQNSDNFHYSGADFDGNAYSDCVVGSASTNPGASITQSSVLTNIGASGTCFSQFNSPSDNFNLTGVTPLSTSLGLASTVAGPIEHPYNATPVPVSDFAIPFLPDFAGNPNFSTAPNTGSGFGASPIATNDVSWDQSGADSGYLSSQTDKNVALMDCNSDGALDAVMTIGNRSADFLGINVLVNSGSALQAASLQALTNLPFASRIEEFSSLAVGDFNNDGIPDVVLALTSLGSSFVEVCINDGSCGFSCKDASQVALDVELGDSPVNPTSIAAGDFNGDGNTDVVVTTPSFATAANRGVAFLFGNGNSGFTSSRVVPFDSTAPAGTPNVLAVGCFDNDNNPDVVVTHGSQAPDSAALGVYSRITTSTQNSTTLNFGQSVSSPWGIDTADFDKQGGDDIMMVADDITNTANPRQAFVFLNTVETIVANAGSDVTSSADVVQLTGTCATNPADSTAEFATTWTILSPSSGATLTNATTLTPTLTATAPGTYVVQLTCRTRCKDTATDTVSVTIGNSSLCLEGSGAFTGSPSNNCGAGCSLGMAPFSWVGILSFFSGIGVLWSVRRRLK